MTYFLFSSFNFSNPNNMEYVINYSVFYLIRHLKIQNTLPKQDWYRYLFLLISYNSVLCIFPRFLFYFLYFFNLSLSQIHFTVFPCIHLKLHVSTHRRTQTHTHTHIHIYIYIYIYIYMRFVRWQNDTTAMYLYWYLDINSFLMFCIF